MSTMPAAVVARDGVPAQPTTAHAPHPILVPGLALALGYGLVAQGGFFWPQAAVVATVLAIAATVAVRSVADIVRTPLLAFGLLALGLAASAAAAGWPVAARLPAAGLAAAVGAFVVGAALVRSGARDTVVEVLAAIGTLAAAVGIVALAVHADPLAMHATGLWRLSSTLTYANAAGALMVLTLPATLLLAARRPAIGRLAATLVVAGLAVSLSRGALLACVALVAGLAWGAPALLRRLARPAVAGAVLAAGLVPAMVSPSGRPLPALAAALAALAIAAPARISRPVAWAGAVVLAVAVSVALTAGGAASRILDSRGQVSSDPRLATWSATLDTVRAHPLLGTGPGTYRVVQVVGGEVRDHRFAHNEYLQALAETGVAGLASVLAAVAMLAAWALRRRPSGDDRALWTAGVATMAAFLLHASVDFVWRFPLLLVVVFLWLPLAAVRPSGLDRKAER